MKKGLKITLIVLVVMVGVVLLDTLQAKIFDNSPLLKIRENLDGGSTDYIDKGLLVNHYHCNNNEKVTTWKGTKFACSQEEVNASDLQYTYNQVIEYFGNKDVDRDNLGSCYLDEDKKVVIVELINNSKEEQEKFIKQANVNSKYIKFEQGGPYTVGPGIAPVIDFYLTKPKLFDTIRFKLYASNSVQRVYLSGNIEEFYVIHGGILTLKEYMEQETPSSFESINNITNQLTIYDSLNDGGTTIYKSKDKDITIITCNKLNGNNNIYIGDYSLEFEDNMCQLIENE